MRGIGLAIVGANAILLEALRRIFIEAGCDFVLAAPSIEAFAADADERVQIVLLVSDHWGQMLSSARARFPAARAVILSSQCELQVVRSAFSQGAAGYLLNDISPERLIAMLQVVATGERIVPSQLADERRDQQFADRPLGPARRIDLANLSAREAEILLLLTMGLSNKEISRRLSISEATVKVHVKGVLRKLNVANRTQAAMWATGRGLFVIHGDRHGAELVHNGRSIEARWYGASSDGQGSRRT